MKNFLVLFVTALFIIFTNTSCRSEAAHHEHKHAQHEDLALSGEIKNGVRTIDLTASRYRFDPDPIVVKLGEKVRLVCISKDVVHGLSISEFGVSVIISPGKTGTADFVVNKEGEFHAHCSVYCGSGHSGMHAKFIVIK